MSGVRIPTFARELAGRGHRIVLVTRTLKDSSGAPGSAERAPDSSGERVPTPPGPELETRLDALRSAREAPVEQPFHLAVAPRPHAVLERFRAPGTPPPLRKSLAAYAFFVHGGVCYDWSSELRALWPTVAAHFAPQVVLGTFAPTDTLVAARALAREARCPWVADIKDPWPVFVPFPARTLLRRHFATPALGGAASFVANSVFEAGLVERWFGRDAEVVYSGAPEAAFAPAVSRGGAPALVLLGGIYSEENLKRFVSGVVRWLASRDPGAPRVRFVYAGNAGAAVERCAEPLRAHCDVEIRGYVPLDELMALCRTSLANCYLTVDVTFHHKVLELLCCRRPIVSFPGDQPEVHELAARVGGELHVCDTDAELPIALAAAERAPGPDGRPAAPALHQLGWAAQTDVLEAKLLSVIAGASGLGSER